MSIYGPSKENVRFGCFKRRGDTPWETGIFIQLGDKTTLVDMNGEKVAAYAECYISKTNEVDISWGVSTAKSYTEARNM